MGRWNRWSTALRAVLFAFLLLPLSLASAFPAFARWAAGPAVHVCHCEVRGGHSTCACPICHADTPEFRLSEKSFRGICGDEDPVFAAAHGVAVLPSTLALVLPAFDRAPARRDASPPLDSIDLPPPTPPPRSRA
jgi:hypothetical protein